MTGDAPHNDLLAAVIQAAQEEACSRGHTYIETEHVLLGILRQTDHKAVQLMAAHGFTYEAVRDALDAIIPARRPSPPTEVSLLQFSPKASAALQAARKEVSGRRLGLSHLLAALLAQRDAVSAGVLEAVASRSGRWPVPFDLSDLERQIRDLARQEGSA